MSVKDFQVIAKLGEGAYSSVYKVKRIADQADYALKKVKLANLSEKEKQNALNEVRILASIRCLNIVSYKEVFLDTPSNSLCIVMEYVNHGDLFQKIVDCQKKGTLIPEPEIWSIFIQVTKGLKSLHDLKIHHRDLKSANVFLNKDGSVKLGDMNVSKIAKKGLLYTQTGTPYYASPEVWKDQPYDQKSDIWSLGCVLYEITTLKPPFRAEDMEGLYKKVIRGYYPKIPQSYSQDLNNVIRVLLQVPPHLRPSCDKLLQLPAMLKRMDEKLLIEADEGMPNLLQTIRIPKNMHYLTERLPKPNYSPLKLKKIDKHKFIQTLGVSPLSDIDDVSEIKENHSAEYSVNRLPKIQKRSNPPERHNAITPSKHEQPGDSYIQLKNHNDNSEIGIEKRQKNHSKHQQPSKINYEELLLQEKKKLYMNPTNISQSNDNQYEKNSAINQIYGGIKKLRRKQPNQEGSVLSSDKNGSIKPQKQKHAVNLLDIEGEQKQLSVKVKKNQNSLANIREDSIPEYKIYYQLQFSSDIYDYQPRLPQISKDKRSNLPTLINNHAVQSSQQKVFYAQYIQLLLKLKEEVQEQTEKKQKRVIEGKRAKDNDSNKQMLPEINQRTSKNKAYKVEANDE